MRNKGSHWNDRQELMEMTTLLMAESVGSSSSSHPSSWVCCCLFRAKTPHEWENRDSTACYEIEEPRKDGIFNLKKQHRFSHTTTSRKHFLRGMTLDWLEASKQQSRDKTRSCFSPSFSSVFLLPETTCKSKARRKADAAETISFSWKTRQPRMSQEWLGNLTQIETEERKQDRERNPIKG